MVERNVVDEVDAYSNSVAGIDIEAVRSSGGTGPNEVLAAQGSPFTFTSCSVGFPMRSRTTIPDDRIIAAAVTAAPQGSRWCEIDLRPGSLIVYGPATEHTAVNLPGLQFNFTITTVEQLAETADLLGLPVVMPPDGQAHELSTTDRTQRLAPALTSFAEAAGRSDSSMIRLADDVMRALASALGERGRLRRVGGGPAVDSRHIVHQCIDYADSTQRIPSISELCLVAHVSERRLREAFVREFDQPPSRYFRNWALEAAHRRLRDGDPAVHSVTEIAADIGFDHLGRFAGNYRALYDEPPSTTLQTSRPFVS